MSHGFRHMCLPCESTFVTDSQRDAPCPFCGQTCGLGSDVTLRRAVLHEGPTTISYATWPSTAAS